LRKLGAAVGSLLFVPLVPGVIAGYVPWLICRWQFQRALFDARVDCIVGALLIAVGIVPLLESIGRFALKGLGTPAPVFPTNQLVVSGFYRHVRNPMYLGVVAIILGQALLFGDLRLVAYAALVWVFMHLFSVAYEEPTLRRTFGDAYDTYRAHVPRWIPRLGPWRGA
jgi:protein-S-isoprenylcysteine O-methyltransferase Ste14